MLILFKSKINAISIVYIFLFKLIILKSHNLRIFMFRCTVQVNWRDKHSLFIQSERPFICPVLFSCNRFKLVSKLFLIGAWNECPHVRALRNIPCGNSLHASYFMYFICRFLIFLNSLMSTKKQHYKMNWTG